MVVAYLSSDLKTPDDRGRFNTNVHIRSYLLLKYKTFYHVLCVIKKSTF